MLLTVLLGLIADFSPTEIDAGRFHVRFPMPVTQIALRHDDTPWGPASVLILGANDATGISYEFSEAGPDRRGGADAAGLGRVVGHFAQRHKCTAHAIADRPLADAEDRIHPQIVFEGHCAAPVAYRIATILVADRVYTLQVYRPLTFHNPANGHPETAAADDLDMALRDLMAHSRWRVSDMR